jgi:hypothetical protein
VRAGVGIGVGSERLELRRPGSEKKEDLEEVWDDAEDTEEGFVRADCEEFVEREGVDGVEADGEWP